MAVVALMSAKGAPGCTTAAQLLAALWPRPALLVDADAAGGDVALRLPREDGAAVDRDRGLLSLLSLARRSLSPTALVEHAQVLRGGTELVAGLSSPEQAQAGQALWDNLAHALAAARDHDVVVDCGRLTAGSPQLSLAERADLLVCVLRPDVSGLVHARERLGTMQEVLQAGGSGPLLGYVVVGRGAGDRDVVGARAMLERDLPKVRFLGVLADDREGAGVLAGVEVPRPERTLLVRSAHAVVDEVARLVGAAGQPLGGTPPVGGGSAAAAAEAEALGARRAARQRGSRRRFGKGAAPVAPVVPLGERLSGTPVLKSSSSTGAGS